MEAMLFVIVIFVSVFLAMLCLIVGTTIRKLKEEVQDLKEKNHKLQCSEHSLLWQRRNLRNEIKNLVLESNYWCTLKDWMHNEVMEDIRSKKYKNMTVERLYQKAFSKHYKW